VCVEADKKMARKKEGKYIAIPGICPRCLREDPRSNDKNSALKCKVCGYGGHWLQFIQGTKSRKLVQKLFIEGRLSGDEDKLRGDPLLGGSKKPIK